MIRRLWRITPVLGTTRSDSNWDVFADEISVSDGVVKFYKVASSDLVISRDLVDVISLRNVVEIKYTGQYEEEPFTKA